MTKANLQCWICRRTKIEIDSIFSENADFMGVKWDECLNEDELVDSCYTDSKKYIHICPCCARFIQMISDQNLELNLNDKDYVNDFLAKEIVTRTNFKKLINFQLKED